jgi:hypothetical protein
VAVAVAVGLAIVVALTCGAGVAAAQDDGGEVPTRDIVPQPNSGEAPEEAGDRGGSLQLAVFGLVVVAILGGGAYVALQSRRARATPAPGPPPR